MTDQEQIAGHTLELLKRMNAKLDNVAFDVLDLKTRTTGVEEGLASISVRMASIEVSITGVTKRIDRMDERIGRIERRLDLRDENEG